MLHVVVLTVGNDPVLLDTRSQVLRSAGYTVVSARSIKQATVTFVEGDFDLVVLCHSISEEDRQRFAVFIRERTLRTPVVFVASSLGQRDPSADVTIQNDPDDLIAGLRTALTRNREWLDDRQSQGLKRPQI